MIHISVSCDENEPQKEVQIILKNENQLIELQRLLNTKLKVILKTIGTTETLRLSELWLGRFLSSGT